MGLPRTPKIGPKIEIGPAIRSSGHDRDTELVLMLMVYGEEGGGGGGGRIGRGEGRRGEDGVGVEGGGFGLPFQLINSCKNIFMV